MPCNFSRASMPGKIDADALHKFPVYRHVGLYAYRREQLLAFTKWNSTPYELAEGLEQLRFLEHGVPIHVVENRYITYWCRCSRRLGAGEANFINSIRSALHGR